MTKFFSFCFLKVHHYLIHISRIMNQRHRNNFSIPIFARPHLLAITIIRDVSDSSKNLRFDLLFLFFNLQQHSVSFLLALHPIVQKFAFLRYLLIRPKFTQLDPIHLQLSSITVRRLSPMAMAMLFIFPVPQQPIPINWDDHPP